MVSLLSERGNCVGLRVLRDVEGSILAIPPAVLCVDRPLSP